jgi:MFS family permease
MQNEKLAAFVAASKSKGASDDFHATLLMRRGWPRDVFDVMGAYREGVTGLCIPERTDRGESARDGFLYLLAFLTLAIWSSALGSMLFQFIDHWFPDPVVVAWRNLRVSVTWQMASVAVAFPIFAIAMRVILREATQSPERLQSGVRRWLTYIALLLTASGVVCDLIVFLNTFLQGGLTARFVLKVLTVLVICGAIFVYYLGSLQWGCNFELLPAKKQSLIFGLSSLAVLALAFSTGLSVAGTPSVQRQIQADKRRVEDLRRLASSVYSWRRRSINEQQRAAIPLRLTDAVGGDNRRTLDPEMKRPYEYVPVEGTRY